LDTAFFKVLREVKEQAKVRKHHKNNKYIAVAPAIPVFHLFFKCPLFVLLRTFACSFTSLKTLKNAVSKPFLQYQISLKHAPIYRIT
jgi:hypothetical protein